ncbi:MAG: 2-amino-4-hydroxy-6-hydroxymethyldihydropteridine diphosphokinase [Pseudomonadales bacterium]
MTIVFLGLGTNVDRERSMCAGLEALARLDPDLVISNMYESDAVGFDGAAFYNCVVQLRTQLPLAELVGTLKAIENANGRDRSSRCSDSKGLDIDVLTYGDLVGCYVDIELPRSDILKYAHVLRPLSDIAPDACLPGTQSGYEHLWQSFDSTGQLLWFVDFSCSGLCS